MSARFSKAIRNFMLEAGSLKQALSNCKIKFYTGSQPADADAAPTGTLLVTFTKSGGAHTAEVLSSGSMTLTGGGSGSVNTVTVNSIDILGAAVNYNTSLAQTALDVITQINNNPANLLFVASSGGSAVITIKAKPGLGALPNGWVVSATLTTITASYSNMASGVTAVNGLTWGDAAAGVLVKHPTEVWQGTAVASGTAGWYRVEAAVADSGGADGSEVYLRHDGAIAASGGEVNSTNTSISSGGVQTLNSFTITLPTA
jgi:hypothetical protein